MEEYEEKTLCNKALTSSWLSIGGVFAFWLFIAVSKLSWGLITFNVAYWLILAMHASAIIIALYSLIEIKGKQEKGYFYAFGSILNSAIFIFVTLTLLRYLFFPKF